MNGRPPAFRAAHQFAAALLYLTLSVCGAAGGCSGGRNYERLSANGGGAAGIGGDMTGTGAMPADAGQTDSEGSGGGGGGAIGASGGGPAAGAPGGTPTGGGGAAGGPGVGGAAGQSGGAGGAGAHVATGGRGGGGFAGAVGFAGATVAPSGGTAGRTPMGGNVGSGAVTASGGVGTGGIGGTGGTGGTGEAGGRGGCGIAGAGGIAGGGAGGGAAGAAGTAPHILSIDFVGGAIGYAGGGGHSAIARPRATTEVAGVRPAANWNAAFGSASATPLTPLVLDDGSPFAGSVTWSAPGMAGTLGVYSLGYPDAPGDVRMMNGYLDPVIASPVVTITVSGLGALAGGYDVYVYSYGFLSDTDTRSRKLAIGANTFTLTQMGPSPATFPGYVLGANGNYVVFKQVTGASFTLTATAVSGATKRAPVNGLQISWPTGG